MLSPSREAVNFFKVENPSSLLKDNLQSKVILFQQSFYSVFQQHWHDLFLEKMLSVKLYMVNNKSMY